MNGRARARSSACDNSSERRTQGGYGLVKPLDGCNGNYFPRNQFCQYHWGFIQFKFVYNFNYEKKKQEINIERLQKYQTAVLY